MLALSRVNQLAGLRYVEGTLTYSANRLAGVIQDCDGLYECCHVVVSRCSPIMKGHSELGNLVCHSVAALRTLEKPRTTSSPRCMYGQ